jgi:hypothetical protein
MGLRPPSHGLRRGQKKLLIPFVFFFGPSSNFLAWFALWSSKDTHSLRSAKMPRPATPLPVHPSTARSLDVSATLAGGHSRRHRRPAWRTQHDSRARWGRRESPLLRSYPLGSLTPRPWLGGSVPVGRAANPKGEGTGDRATWPAEGGRRTAPLLLFFTSSALVLHQSPNQSVLFSKLNGTDTS